MDALTRFALVGTSRQEEPEEAGALVDAVLTRLAELPLERRVLLAAGARAAAAMAGHRPLRNDTVVAIAPPETRRVCSAKAARLVGDLLRGHHEELLPEALALLDRAAQRLPHALLPDALRLRGDHLRDQARRVIGERGAWLARMNDAWSWAATALPAASIDDLERAWGEGTPAARRALLAQARGIDPERARRWLEATWSSEKADERAALLALLRTGIGIADEAFLEAQLRDRSAGVREAAQMLLPHVPESAFVRRMTERADAMLGFKRSALGFLGKRGALEVSPPEKVDDTAERDGLLAKPPQAVGARAFWLTRALGSVPPAHWAARLEASAEVLVAAAEATDWSAAVCEGWTRAALVHGAIDWLTALWDFWQRTDDKVASDRLASAMLLPILARLPPGMAAERVEALATGARTRIDVTSALGALAAPWPARLGARWVSGLGRDLAAATAVPTFLPSLRLAALALPPECFAAALASIDRAAAGHPWERPLADFSEVLRLRRDLVQEIVP